MSNVKRFNIDGQEILCKDPDAREAIADIKENIDRLLDMDNLLYVGRDLTVVHAAEIAQYSSVWTWIKARITAGNFKGIHVRDFIPMSAGETVYAEVAGINTHKRTTDQELGNHIDFISRDCLGTTVQWNTSNNNNGNSQDATPYMVSNVKGYLLNTVYPKLPSDLKSVITNKRTLMETRYSASGTLNDSNSWAWKDLGPIWLPTEYEVFGSIIWGTKGWSEGQGVQYPIFANSFAKRIKGLGHNGSRYTWWLAVAHGGDSTHACYVSSYGLAYADHCSYSLGVPLCFRIAA